MGLSSFISELDLQIKVGGRWWEVLSDIVLSGQFV